MKQENIDPMRDWARHNGLEDRYDQFLSEVEDLNEEFEDVIPSRGVSYEMRLADLESSYPELFSDDDDSGYE